MYCISCGGQLPKNAFFCLQCGTQQRDLPISETMRPKGWSERQLQKGLSFLDNWMAVVALAILATVTTILFAVGSKGFATQNATDILQQFCLVGALATAALVSMRTGGLDLSVGGIMALSSVIFAMNAAQNSAGTGFLLALVVCGAIGLLNGLFIMVARVPSVLVTVASAMLTRGIALWASEGVPVQLSAGWMQMNAVAAVLALVASVGIAIFLLWRTGRFAQEKKNIHGQMKFFWVYGLIALIGMLAGWAAAICFGTADAGKIGFGSSNEMILLFIFAALSASGLFKSNWVALGGALVLAMLWTIHDQAMILLQLSPFSMIVSNACWVFILLGVMCFAKRSWKKPMWEDWGR